MNEDFLIWVRMLAGDRDMIPYRRKIALVTGSMPSAVLLQQCVYWWEHQDFKPFYKFKLPCDHGFYKPGDSWCEELGIKRDAFDHARSLIAVKKKSGQDLRTVGAYALELDPPHPVLYWTTANRMTYYSIHAPALEKFARICYIGKPA